MYIFFTGLVFELSVYSNENILIDANIFNISVDLLEQEKGKEILRNLFNYC